MSEVKFEIVKIVLCAVVGIISIMVTRVAVPYIQTLRLTAEQELALYLIEKAVRAVEQTIKETGQGKAKKAEVVKFVQRELAEKGISITDEQIDKLIEAAVYSMNREQINIIAEAVADVK